MQKTRNSPGSYCKKRSRRHASPPGRTPRFEILSVRVGQRLTGDIWIWTSGQNQLQSNFNLFDYLFIKIPKMNVKDTVQEKNSKIENWTDVYDNELTH